MPVLQTFDFDSPAVATMNESVGAFQLLQVTLNSWRVKRLTDIHCGYIRQANILLVPPDAETAIANTFIQGRVIVVTGRIDFTDVPVNSLLQAVNPISAAISREVIPYSRVLFNQPFINSLSISFSTPKEVLQGEEVHVILSQGYAISDTGILVSSSKVGSLNVGGYYAEQATSEIGGWKLR